MAWMLPQPTALLVANYDMQDRIPFPTPVLSLSVHAIFDAGPETDLYLSGRALWVLPNDGPL